MESSMFSAMAHGFVAGMVEDGIWRPGIGDPTLMGWVTVLAYMSACALCLWALARVPAGLAPIDVTKHHLFWGSLGLIMALLAVNKQLDLQQWFWLTGRNMIRTNGWYHQRRILQFGWLAAIALVGGMGLAYFGWLTRNQSRQRFVAFLGMVFTVCFVLVRAGSLHHVDTILGWHVSGVRMNWILENCGIALVAIGAVMAVRAPGPTGAGA